MDWSGVLNSSMCCLQSISFFLPAMLRFSDVCGVCDRWGGRKRLVGIVGLRRAVGGEAVRIGRRISGPYLV